MTEPDAWKAELVFINEEIDEEVGRVPIHAESKREIQQAHADSITNYRKLFSESTIQNKIHDKIEEIFDILEAQAESRKENFEEVEETEAKEWEYGYEAGISDAKKELKEELLEEVQNK